MATFSEPETLLEAVKFFSNKDVAFRFAASIKWPDGKPLCPKCGGESHYFLSTRQVWKCKACSKQFSVKVGTIFEDSPIGLDKWLPAMWMLTNCKNGISSYELGRALGVTQKSAWFMLSRLRLALQSASGGKLSGGVEVDETYIGGQARYMHKAKKERVLQGRKGGLSGKVAVMGLLQRHPGKGQSQVRLEVIKGVRKSHLVPKVKAQIETGSTIYSDALGSYTDLRDDYTHKVIDHAEKYAEGTVHTNGMENFWSLLKRMLKGTYVSVEPFHLFRYLDEEAFRFNMRGGNDRFRFLEGLKGIIGKRLTYTGLTGSELPETC